MLMALKKMPLVTLNPMWKKTSIGDVKCASCGWHGRFYSLLSESCSTSRRLYCPLCTSTKWFYVERP